MSIRATGFNMILALGVMLLAAGCQTSEERRKGKEVTLLRFHLSTNPDETDRTTTIYMPRGNPVPVHLQVSPFMDEGEILRAAVVDSSHGGHELRLQFTRRGVFLLDTYLNSNRGRLLVIQAQFESERRWLAAPMIREKMVEDGMLTFAPDASREESERIAHGLNNIAERLHKARRF